MPPSADMEHARQGEVEPTRERSVRVWLRRASGPISTVLMAGLIEVVRSRGMPALPLVLMLVIAYSVIVSGTAAGIVSAAIAIIYAGFYYGTSEELLRENLGRLVIFAASTPLVVFTLGHLRKRFGELMISERDLRRQAEIERTRLLGTLESITDGFFALDRDWRYTYVNRQAERMVGRPRDELLGKIVWESFPALVGSTWDHEYHRAVAQRVVVRFEEYYPPLDTWFETHAYPSDGGLTIYLRPINERKRSEHALRSRALQQAAIAAFGQRVLVERDLHAVMDDAVRMLSATLDVELVKILELLADEDALVMRTGVGWRAGVEHRVAAGECSQAGYTLRSRGPVIVDDLTTETRFQGPMLLLDHGVVSGMSVIVGGRDRPFGILSAHTRSRRAFTEGEVHVLQTVANILADAIERKRAEDALAESELRFRQLAENVHEVFYVMTTSPAQVLYVSPAYEVVWGRSCASLCEQPLSWLDAIHPDDRPEVANHVGCRSGAFDVDYRILRGDGAVRWIHDRSFPVRDHAGRTYRVVGIAEDVTDLKEAAQTASRLAASEAEVRARDDVLAVVAHDLRNPLGTISMGAALLENGEMAADKRAHHARMIQRAAARAERLVHDLLDVARIESGQLVIESRSVAPDSVTAEVYNGFRDAAQETSVTLACDSAPAVPYAWGDHDRIVQALENLVSNALKFTPRGGQVTIRARACREGIDFSVEDTGPGIAPDVLPHVFDRFWRARPAERKGLGLGLCIVKGIVTAHRGRAWVESELGKGSTFHFAIPSAPALEDHRPVV